MDAIARPQLDSGGISLPQNTKAPLRLITCGAAGVGKTTLLEHIVKDSRTRVEDRASDPTDPGHRNTRRQNNFGLALLVDGLQAGSDQDITIHRFKTGAQNIIATDLQGGERYTRNLASLAPAAGVQAHQLPRPATPGKMQMQRVAVETVVDSKIGPVSIINTHLAFHDDNENQQQVRHLNQLEQERAAHHREPKRAGSGTYREGFLAAARMLCGDFNFTPDTSQYRYQVDMNWGDAWQLRHGDAAHPPTCGIFDRAQWPQGGHCRDFFWLSPELQNLPVDISVDTDSKLSDHQPVMLEISI